MIVSFRLGGVDGVSIEAAKWRAAMESLGHEVTTVAGAGRAEVLLPGLAIDAKAPPSVHGLNDAFGDADLVLVENLASLPLNPPAREVLYDVLSGRPALFRHHDLPWQRPHLAHLEGPRDAPTWRHVTINELSRLELLGRAIVATTIRNSFDCDPPRGHRERTRRALDVGSQLLALAPTRAIPRKNLEGALALCASLGADLWLLGPSEDGYETALRELIEASPVTVRRGAPSGVSIHDAYAACDLVVMASSCEGFGNPVLESVTHQRPLALNPYPVAREITAHGFDFFDLEDVAGLASFLARPDEALFEHNLDVARAHFNLNALPERLAGLLSQSGIEPPQ